MKFEWDLNKEIENIKKHKIDFTQAQEVFVDSKVIHLEDIVHSKEEARFYAVGQAFNEEIITVRYAWRGEIIRIIGAARWRKWRKYYEENTKSK